MAQLTLQQVWAQVAYNANELATKKPFDKSKWEAYYEVLVLIGPAPLLLVDKTRPCGLLRHPLLGDPGSIPGSIAG